MLPCREVNKGVRFAVERQRQEGGRLDANCRIIREDSKQAIVVHAPLWEQSSGWKLARIPLACSAFSTLPCCVRINMPRLGKTIVLTNLPARRAAGCTVPHYILRRTDNCGTRPSPFPPRSLWCSFLLWHTAVHFILTEYVGYGRVHGVNCVSLDNSVKMFNALQRGQKRITYDRMPVWYWRALVRVATLLIA